MARSVKMMSDMDTTMMEIERVERVGDRLMVTGMMMGNFPAQIFLEPRDLLGIFALHLQPSPLSFVLGLPYFWLRCHWRRPENDTIAARAKGVLLSAAIVLGGIVVASVVVLGVVQLLRLLA